MHKKKLSHLFSTAEFEKDGVISDIISKYKVKILYTGSNRNGSYFKESVVEQMCKSMGGVPIIGYYSQEKGDFTSHYGEYIEKVVNHETGKTTEQYLPTVPYGFVPTDPEITWETSMDKDGVERKYLSTTVYLWDGRYPELSVLGQGRANNLSMELNPDTIEGDWINVTEGGIESSYFCFSKADFLGFCILGKDIEPCFEGAAFDPMFALKQEEEINTTLTNMGDELKEALSYSLKSDTTEEEKEAEKEKEPLVNSALAGSKVVEEEPTMEDTPIELTPEDISESTEEFVFTKDEPVNEEGPTIEELKVIEAEEESEPLETPEEILKDLEEDFSKKEKIEKIEDTSVEDVVPTIEEQFEELKVQFDELKVKYETITAELAAIYARKGKLEYLEKEKENISVEDYELIVSTIDNFSQEKLEAKVQKCGFEYLKNLRNFNHGTEKDKNEPSSEVIYDFASPSDAFLDAPEWVREVKKAQR